ncbi:MAG: hypothetical protein ACO3K7_02050, partial [Candidatus Marinamargulisbacteria bacterium]
ILARFLKSWKKYPILQQSLLLRQVKTGRLMMGPSRPGVATTDTISDLDRVTLSVHSMNRWSVGNANVANTDPYVQAIAVYRDC